MKSNIATQWLEKFTHSANNKDFDAHMGLISKKVNVFGVPRFEVIDYADWSAQCEHEFSQGILKKVAYKGMKILVNSPGKIMFKTLETIESTDNDINTMAVEIVLEKENDGEWRLTQERVLNADEMEHDLTHGGY